MTPEVRKVPERPEYIFAIEEAELPSHDRLRKHVGIGGAEQANHEGEQPHPARCGSVMQLAVHSREPRRQDERTQRVITHQILRRWKAHFAHRSLLRRRRGGKSASARTREFSSSQGPIAARPTRAVGFAPPLALLRHCHWLKDVVVRIRTYVCYDRRDDVSN